MRQMKSKTRSSIYPQHLTIGNIGHFHNDRLVVHVNAQQSEVFGEELSDFWFWTTLKPSPRPCGDPSPLIGTNLCMTIARESKLLKTFPTLTQELTVIPSLLDTLLLSDSNQHDRLAATDKLKNVFKDACDSLQHCRDCHRLRDRKPVGLEFALATSLPAPSDWMDGFLQDNDMNVSSFVKVADSHDMCALVDHVCQKHWIPLERLIAVPNNEIPNVTQLSASDKTALMLNAEIVAKFFSPMCFKSPVPDNIHRRGESQEPLHVPMSCLRPPSQAALESLGLFFGLDPKLHPTTAVSKHSSPIMPSRSSQRTNFTSTSAAGKVRLQSRCLLATGHIDHTLKRHAILGDSASSAHNEIELGRFEDVPIDKLAGLSRQRRIEMLDICCTVVWELHFETWKVRINNNLKKKNLSPIVTVPRNTTELAQLDPEKQVHVRLVRPSDRSKNKDELKPLVHQGACAHPSLSFFFVNFCLSRVIESVLCARAGRWNNVHDPLPVLL